jgi:3'-5' exonuclease
VSLRNFLAEPPILKVGYGIKGDLQRLQKESGCQTPFSAWIDLAQMAMDCHVAPNAQVGLAELCALVLKSKTCQRTKYPGQYRMG